MPGAEGYRSRRLAARRSRRFGAYQNLALYALAAAVAFGAVLGAVHLAHSLRHHHVLPSAGDYLALVQVGGGSDGAPTAAVLVHNAAQGATTLYTIPSDLLLTTATGEYVMAGDVAAEDQLPSYLGRLFDAPLSYRLDLSYADLARLAGGGAVTVTAATPFSLQMGSTSHLYGGTFTLAPSDLSGVLTAAGKGNTDQATAQVAVMDAVLSAAAAVPAARRTATIAYLADKQKHIAPVDARDLLATLCSGQVTTARLPSNGQVAQSDLGTQFAWRPDAQAIMAQITRNARGFLAPYTVLVENGSGAVGVGRLVVERLASMDVNLPAVRNAGSFGYQVTQIQAGSQAFGVASQVRAILGHGYVLTGSGLPATTVVVIVGKDITAKDLQ
jgi:hypothetical protein